VLGERSEGTIISVGFRATGVTKFSTRSIEGIFRERATFTRIGWWGPKTTIYLFFTGAVGEAKLHHQGGTHQNRVKQTHLCGLPHR